MALLVLSLGVLAGWLTGAMRLASWGEGLVATTPLAASCFLTIGFAFCIQQRVPASLTAGLGILVALVGGVCALAFVAGSTGSDAMMVSPGHVGQAPPVDGLGMWPSAAVGFTFAGLGLALRARKGAGTFAVGLAGLVGVVGIIAVLEQAFGYDNVDAVPGFGSVPLPTGVGFLLVSAGLLLRKGRGRPEMSLRLALGTLVLAALLPAVVFMASQARRAAEERLASFEREGRDLAGTLGAYVDKLIAERVGLITGLASSPALRSRDLEAFYQQARSVIDPAEGNVVIFDRSLKMLLNTGQPFGTELPGAVETNSAARALITRRIEISDAFVGSVNGRWIVGISKGVDGTEFALRITIWANAISDLLRKSAPEGWITAIADREGKIIARSHDPDRWTGEGISPSVWPRACCSETGWMRGETLERLPVYAGWKRLPFGWTVLVGVDERFLRGEARTQVARVSIGALFVSILGLCLAAGTAFAVARSLEKLSQAAATVGRGELPLPLRTNVREIDSVGAALRDAAAKRQAADFVLRDSEERLRRFVDQAPAAIAMFDRDMRYVAYSRRWLREYVLKNENLIGRSHYEVFPELSDRWKAIHKRGFAGEVVREDEDVFIRADGRMQWLRWEMRPWHYADGNIGGITIASEDVTARVVAEHALRDRERLLRAVTDNAAVGMVMLDRERRYTFVNPTYVRILGLTLTSEEMLGKTPAEVLAPIYASQIAPRLDRVFAGERVAYELARPFADAELKYYVVVYDPVHGGGALVTGVIVTIFDITERRRSEEEVRASQQRLKAIVDTAADAIVVIDDLGHIQSINPATERLFGYSPADLVGENVSKLMPEPDRTKHDSYLEAFLRTGKAKIIGRGREVEGRRKDGSVFPIDLSVVEWRLARSVTSPASCAMSPIARSAKSRSTICCVRSITARKTCSPWCRLWRCRRPRRSLQISSSASPSASRGWRRARICWCAASGRVFNSKSWYVRSLRILPI